jgi:hypothetical protein
MKLTSEELRRLYQRQTTRSVAGRVDCLSEGAMTRAAVGELSQAEREMVADHLTACSDCAQEYRLLRRLKPLTGRAGVSADEGDSVVEPAMGEPDEEGRVVVTQPGWPRRLTNLFFPRLATYVIIAALLFISLACVAWVISLRRENLRMTARLEDQLSNRDQTSQSLAETRRQLEEVTRRAEEQQKEIAEMRRSVDDLSRPQVNVPITDLELQNVRGGAGSAVTTVTAQADANLFMLILHIAAESAFSDYALEVLDGQGRRVWRAQGLRRSQADTFTVTLQRRLLPAGQYRLRLYGLRAGRSEAIGDYAIRVSYK